MSVVEEIMAAIVKLIELREASLEGPWTRTDELWEGAGRYDVHGIDGPVTTDGDGIGSIGNVAEADLIVTLHRTIDAQLTVMRDAVAEYDYSMWLVDHQTAIHFARAINGDA